MKYLLTILCFLICLPVDSYAQQMSGRLDTYLNAYIDNMPGNSGDDYQEPSNLLLSKWASCVNSLLYSDTVMARSLADELNYQIVSFSESVLLPGEQYYILEEKSPQQYYWGTYVFNRAACRKDLVIQSPHPRYDSNTGKQAAYCFSRLSARALFISGTHRCNHQDLSSCDGTTSVCGSSSDYRITDMAHNVAAAFQKATEALSIVDTQTIFVQLHGFGKKATDPYIIFSNGTRITPNLDYIQLLQTELTQIDNSLSFKAGHLDLSWTRLLGFSNTQGRMLNASPSPCDDDNTSVAGRFIHIEQERSKLRLDSTVWDKMYQAMAGVFTCQALAVDRFAERSPFSVYPNPLQGSQLSVRGGALQSISLYDLGGRLIMHQSLLPQSEYSLTLPSLAAGIYTLALEAEKQVYRQKLVLH